MKQSKHRTAKLVRDYLIIFVIGAVLLYPIIWMLFASFKSNDEIFGSIRLLPQNFSFKYFIDGWKGSGKATYTNFFINTFLLVIPTTIFTVMSSALVAYGFARFQFPGKKILFVLLIAMLMLPNSAGLFQFLWTYNDYFNSLVFINSVKKFPISLALRMSLDAESVVQWGKVMAMAFVAVVPVILLFFAAQRYFVEGIATSGLKG